MNPPTITTPSGRKSRARFHASWSPAGRLRSRKTVVRLLGVLGGLLAVLLVGIPVYATSFLSSLPDVHGLDASALKGDTIIQARDGTQLADIGFREGDRRLTVTLDQVSPKLIDATVSIEDKTFWTNSGFDSEAIIRTAATNFRAGGVTGGASTITQQLAKRLFLSSEQSVDRKVKELVLAYELSKTYEKKKILELYLNETYYGDEQYGVQAAAQTYFHRDAKTVDLAQAAMLAGLPQAPDAYNPALHLEAAQARQREVLDAMVRDQKITPQEAAAARSEKLQIFSAVTNYKAPHFVRYVEQELRKLGFKPGLQQLVVKTTLDYGKQQMAEKVVKDNWQANIPKDPDGKLSSSMVALDPQTGQIVVYVGGPDPSADCFECDFVTGTPVNPGSSLKPFTYAAAIRDGKITMETPIADGPSPYVVNWPGTPTYKVYNYDKGTHGNPPARVALASSLNIPAVKVELAVGVPAVVELQRNLGLRPRISHDGGKYTLDDPATSFGPSLTLGGYSITLLEEASAFATIAAMGTYHQPEAILQVTDVKGRPLYQADPNRGARPNALDPKVAFIIASILDDDNNRAPIFGRNSKLHLPDRHSAAKTGTTENYHDALTFGFTPDLVAGVWVGDTGDFTHHMIGKSDAIYVAAPAWYSFMQQALKGVADKWYTPPKGLKGPVGNSWFLPETLKVDRLPGDNPSPSPSGQDHGIPPDPRSGPQRTDKCPRNLPPIPIPIPCVTP